MSKHTPTPWHHNGGKDGIALAIWNSDGSGREVPHKDEIQICVQGDFDAHQPPREVVSENMRFIVRACNAHEELLEALNYARLFGNQGTIEFSDNPEHVGKSVSYFIDAAIAKASP